MNYEMRPPRRGLIPNLSPDLINQIARVEYTVFTKASPALAWKIFSNIDLWPKFFGLYRSIRWQGTPWTPGSRLRMEVADPINAVIDRVVTVCMPPHNVAWINHVRGYTMEQWVSLDPLQGGGTRVSTWIEVTGGETNTQRSTDFRILETIVRDSFDNFSRECDHVADTHRGDIPGAAD